MAEKILIVDDDIDTLRLVGLMLQHQGYEICAASTGQQGIEKAASEHPDVILLDVMMPDMDGYEVTRRLRKDPRTQSTPILMFTAKSQLEDKVTGFEVGVDDYLIKPTNPTQLQSHVRLLLEHARDRKAAEAAAEAAAHRAHAIAVLAARGGLGVSMLAVNMAAALRVRSKGDVILAELTPGKGTLGLDLGAPNQKGLTELLTSSPNQITNERVNTALTPHNSGLRLLLASENPRDAALLSRTEQFEALFERLVSLAPFVVLDLGSVLAPWAEKILPLCQDRLVVIEASPNTVSHTRRLIDDMTAMGIDPNGITVVLNHRVRIESQMPWTMVEQSLAHPIAATLSPAPELMVTATRRHLPAVMAVPEDVTSQQILKLSERVLLPETGA